MWVLGSFGILFQFTKTLMFGKSDVHQGASRSTKRNSINKSINRESLSRLSGSTDSQSLRNCKPVQYNQYAETYYTLETQKNITWTPRTVPRRQRLQRHLQNRHQRPDLVNLNLRSLYLQCPEVDLRMVRLRVWELLSADYRLQQLKSSEGEGSNGYGSQRGRPWR